MTNKIRYCTALIGLSLLTGCASGLNPLQPDLSAPQDTGIAISIDEMLARAKGQHSRSADKTPMLSSQLLLTFNSNRADLTGEQQDRLHHFANQRGSVLSDSGQSNSALLLINCAPSADFNPYIAASTGISRCLKVSRFLEKRARSTRITLQPSLPDNQIRITE